MKILHINKFQEGGAAWCARRINNALINEGVESRMLFANEEKDTQSEIVGGIADRDPEFWYHNNFLGKIKHLINRIPCYYDEEKIYILLQKYTDGTLSVTPPYSSFKNLPLHPLIEWADVIHLHWVAGFVDYPSFFKRVNKPIVWTLHDKYPACGLQHYNSNFFPIPETLENLDRHCKKIKRNGVLRAKNLHIVAISEMMKQICQNSVVLKGFPCTLIHNGVDINVFTPLRNQETREEISLKFGCKELLDQDKKVFLFSAYGIWDSNKGLDRVIKALMNITRKNIVLFVVGKKEPNQSIQYSFPIVFTGLIKDPIILSQIYSVADFFIQASYEESFGQTVLEAMACGTPVISTPVGISPDLIRPFNGIICSGYTPKDLATGIEQALSVKYDPEAIRAHIVKEYDYSKIAKEYMDLYKSILF